MISNTFKDTASLNFITETTMTVSDNDKTGTDAPVATTIKLTGRVKWFNNKTGFGFINALEDSEGVKEGSDVFVHHSAIKVSQEQYRYLVQGEYVEFVLSKLKAPDASAAAASKHEFQAVDVSGVKGGKLICETRWESRGGGGGQDSGSNWTTVGAKKSSFVPRQGSSEWRRGDSSGRGRGRGGSRGVSDAANE